MTGHETPLNLVIQRKPLKGQSERDLDGETADTTEITHQGYLYRAMPFNLFALMFQLLPEELSHHRVITLRWKVYAIAAKVVRTERQVFIKMTQKNQKILEAILKRIRTLEYTAV